MIINPDPRLQRRQQFAQSLMQRGAQQRPIQHWTQGANQLAQSLLGAYMLKKAGDEQEQRRSETLGGLQGVLATAPEGGYKPNDLIKALSGVPGINQEQLINMQLSQAMSPRAEKPSSVQEWEYFSSLPKDQQDQYLTMKRQQRYLDVGTGFVAPSAVGGPGQKIKKDLPGIVEQKAAETGAAEQAKQDVRAQTPEGQAAARKLEEAERIKQTDIAKADRAVNLIDKAIGHPGREAATGVSAMFNPLALPGGDRKDFLVLVDQLKGQNFLEAFESLKGGGTITEVEGQKAEQAQNRLNESQSEDEYLAALNEMRDLVLQRRALLKGEEYTPPESGSTGGFRIVE